VQARIIIVEDDHLQEGPLEEHLSRAVQGAELVTFSTEREFRNYFPQLRERVPDLVVMDVMLRWSDPEPDAPLPPEEVVSGGYYRAGLRCAQLLAEDEKLRRVPVILHTILERGDLERDGQALPPNCTFVGKHSDLELLSRKVLERLAPR